ncbi:MAG: LuxR C-terminal-related transcriptional regulator [Phycisphaerales bacterium]
MQPTDARPSPTTSNGFLGQRGLDVCFESLLEDAGCAVAVCDAEGRLYFANRTAMQLVGINADEPPIGKTLSDLVTPRAAELRIALIHRALHDSNGRPCVGLCATEGSWRRLSVRLLDNSPGSERVILVCAPLAEPVTLSNLIGPHATFCETAVDLGPLSALTEREMQVLRLIGLGLSTQEIADRLHRSKKTIEWHRVSLGSKLSVSNRVELARLALAAGLTWFDEDAITHLWRHADREEAPAEAE